MLPINEFILWNNCNNDCKFCWQRKEKQQTVAHKLESLMLVKETVSDLFDTHVLYVGGETLAETNQVIIKSLNDLYDLTFDKMKRNEIDQLYINTNILYDINTQLVPILNKAREFDLIRRIHFTTSGDNYGRFRNDGTNSSDELFYDNLYEIRHKYPDLPIYVNIILTDDFCNDVLDNSFDISTYEGRHQVMVNTIPYIKFGAVIGAPTREKVFNTLIKLNEQMPGYLLKYCDNFLLNQKIILHKYDSDNGVLDDVSSDKSLCGHSENFKRCYSDSDECFVCDCKQLKEQLLD